VGRSVVVIGSGAAGLAAAVAAASEGAAVTVLESTPTMGGTTALSGGVSWLPGHGQDAGVDAAADAEGGLRYLQALALGDTEPELAAAFVSDARRVADLLQARTPLSWSVLPYPDYHPEHPGGRPGGRSLDVEPLDPEALDIGAGMPVPLRAPLSWRLPVTHLEVITDTIDLDLVAERRARGTLVMGSALVGALAAGALDHGARILVSTPVTALRLRDGAVAGVEAGGRTYEGEVVIAAGGFERDPLLARTFLPPRMVGLTGAPGSRGDGLRLAMQAGAALGNMNEAWWCPTVRVPGEEIDGEPLHRLILNERARPGSIVVDRGGRRFANEAQNYNDFGRSLHAFDPGSYDYPRAPSWLVFDAAYRRAYTFGPVLRDEPDPEWFTTAGSIVELAEAIGVPGLVLQETVANFNADAHQGRDTAFDRGRSAYDRFVGDSAAPHPTLRPLTEPPFTAVAVHPGCLGTKGGARTDAHGRVVRWDGAVIPGLYAAGNASASPLGLAYPGAGGTIGPALVFGTRAGEAAAQA
jgi:3-oxosteroid 1-dehydrogenase